MNEHLSPQQIDEWMIGQRTREMEGHVRVCRICSDEVRRVAAPLELFGSAVRSWSEEVASTPLVTPSGMWRWRVLLAAAATFLVMIAAPFYRREEMKQQAARDEILLQQVEAGISRSVPAPMEVLAKLMSNYESERSQ